MSLARPVDGRWPVAQLAENGPHTRGDRAMIAPYAAWAGAGEVGMFGQDLELAFVASALAMALKSKDLLPTKGEGKTGAVERTRTFTPFGRYHLKVVRLPIPPRPHTASAL